MKLDLFERRYKLWSSIAENSRSFGRLVMRTRDMASADFNERIDALWQDIRISDDTLPFLFGRDAKAKADRLIAALQTAYDAKENYNDVDRVDKWATKVARESWQEARNDLFRKIGEFTDAVHPYINLSAVSITPPKRTFVGHVRMAAKEVRANWRELARDGRT